jgi:hypothetical protein
MRQDGTRAEGEAYEGRENRMSHIHHDDPIEVLVKILVSIAAIPIVITLIIALVAGCFTLVWHIGNWVNWW